MERVYTAPTFLVEDGYNLNGLSVEARWRGIQVVSAFIDDVTQQWFNGENGVWPLTGRGRELIAHKTNIKIPYVEKIEVLSENTNHRGAPIPRGGLPFGKPFATFPWPYLGTGTTTLEATTWALHERAIEKIRSIFPGGAQNILVTGVFGWVDDFRNLDVVSTTIVTAASTTVDVDDVLGFKRRDVIDIVGTNDSIRVVCTAIDRTNNRITFDPVGTDLVASIPAGARVATYGQPPRSIQQLASFLFGNWMREREAVVDGEVVIDPTRIKRERTDDYEYELFAPGAGGATGGGLTGNPRYDLIIQQHSAPAFLRLI